MVQMTESAPPACGPLYEERQRYWERGLGRGGQVYGPDLTLPFSDVPSVLAVFFFKTIQNAWDIPKKGGKSLFFFSKTPDFEKVKKNDGKIAKMAEMGSSGRVTSPKIAMSF